MIKELRRPSEGAKSMAINLKTVIAELQFILELNSDSPNDSRIPGLLDAAKRDLATAAQNIHADDPLIDTKTT